MLWKLVFVRQEIEVREYSLGIELKLIEFLVYGSAVYCIVTSIELCPVTPSFGRVNLFFVSILRAVSLLSWGYSNRITSPYFIDKKKIQKRKKKKKKRKEI